MQKYKVIADRPFTWTSNASKSGGFVGSAKAGMHIALPENEAKALGEAGSIEYPANNQEQETKTNIAVETKVAEKVENVLSEKQEETKEPVYSGEHRGRGVYDIYKNGEVIIDNYKPEKVEGKYPKIIVNELVDKLNAATNEEAENIIAEIKG